MTPDQAADLAARILAAIDGGQQTWLHSRRVEDDHRERVASDLAGLLKHQGYAVPDEDCYECATRDRVGCTDARRYAEGLRRTAALYGVIDQHRT